MEGLPKNVDVTRMTAEEDENFQVCFFGFARAHLSHLTALRIRLLDPFVGEDPIKDLSAMVLTLTQLFRVLIREIVTAARTFEKNVRGYLQISMDSPDFPAINVPFVSIVNISDSAVQLQRDISMKVQSSKNFNLTRGFKFSATLQHIDTGAGRLC